MSRDGLGGAGRFVVHGNDDRLGVVFGGRLDFFDIRVGKAGDFLLLAVVGDLELIRAQTLDRLAGTVGDFDINADHVGLRAKDEGWIRRRRRCCCGGRARGVGEALPAAARSRKLGARARPAASTTASERRKSRTLENLRLERGAIVCLQ